MVSDCKSPKEKKGIEEKSKKKERGKWKKRGEKGENAKGKREKVIMCLFSVKKSCTQEALLVSFVGL